MLTPTRLHTAMAREALLAGCHVFIEKPVSNAPEGVEELKALAEARGKKVMVGFCFRYHAALIKAKRLLEAGRIGRLVSVRALMGEPFYDIHPDYLNLYYARYSGAFELVHDLDLAIWFAGQEIENVQSVYGSFSDMVMYSPDTVEMLVRFRDRCVASVHLDFFQTPRRRQMDLIGTQGVITGGICLLGRGGTGPCSRGRPCVGSGKPFPPPAMTCSRGRIRSSSIASSGMSRCA